MSKIAVINENLSFFIRYRARAELNKMISKVSPILPVYQITGAEDGNNIPTSKILTVSNLKLSIYKSSIQTREGINIEKRVSLNRLMNLPEIIRKLVAKVVATVTPSM